MDAAAVERTIRRRLRRRREALGLTLPELAGRTGLTVQRVQGFEQGPVSISAATLMRLARALDIDVDYFFEGLARGSADRSARPVTA